MESGIPDLDIYQLDRLTDSKSNFTNYGNVDHGSNIEFLPYDHPKLMDVNAESYEQNLVKPLSSDYCVSPTSFDNFMPLSNQSQFEPIVSPLKQEDNHRASVKSLVNSFNRQIASLKSAGEKPFVNDFDPSFLTYNPLYEEQQNPHTDRTQSVPSAYQEYYTQRTNRDYLNSNWDMYNISYMAERGFLQGLTHLKNYSMLNAGAYHFNVSNKSICSSGYFSNSDRIFVLRRGLARVSIDPDFEWKTTGVAIFLCNHRPLDTQQQNGNHQMPSSPIFNLSNSPLYPFSSPDYYDRDEYNFESLDCNKYLITYSDPTIWDVTKTITSGGYDRAFKIESNNDNDGFPLLNNFKSLVKRILKPFLVTETWSSYRAFPISPMQPLTDQVPCRLMVEFIKEYNNISQPSVCRPKSNVKDLTLAVNVFSLVDKMQ